MTAKEALAAARNDQTRAAQDACLTALEDDGQPIEPWVPVLEVILKSTKTENEELAWTSLDALETRLEPPAVIPQARRIMRFFSKNEEFRTRAVDMYNKAFEGTDGLEALLDISGLRGGKPIRRAMQTLDICLGIEPGSYLVHKDDGPPARVNEVDSSTWSVRLETPAGDELLDPVSLGDHYEIAPAHDFRVMSRFDPDAFKDRLAKDPADIVVTILRARGGQMTSDELESMLSPRYVNSTSWSKWWTKVRTGLRKNPRVLLEGRNPVTLIYQEQEISIEDTIWGKVDAHQSPKAWLDLVTEYQRECRDKGVESKEEFIRRMRDAMLVEAQALEDRKEDTAVAGWLTCSAMNQMLGEPPCHEQAIRVMLTGESFKDAIAHLPNDNYVGMALEAVREKRPEQWPEDFVELLPYVHPNRCDAVVEQVRESGNDELLKDIPQKIMSDPVTYASGLCWLYQGPKDTDLFQIPPLITLVTRLLSVLEQLRTTPPEFAKEIKTRTRGVLTAKKFDRFLTCLDQIDEGMASALRTQIQRSSGLSDAVVQDLTGKLRRQFGQLWTQPRKRRWEDDSVLYCTPLGKQSKELELNELVNVKIKENAKAIGEAAAHGDLSENSEYKFALEERDLLQARNAEMTSQLNMSQVIEADDVPVEHVGVGSRVKFAKLGDDGEELTITFLGPWEANVDAGILNYLAPFSQAVMGRVIGDEIEIELSDIKGTYRITAIECGV